MNAAVLNPLTLPLEGVRLIEASAGTGKTWTLATLFVRALLEPPCRQVSEVLVLTFTDAATAELRGRIRERLVEARDVLAGTPTDDGVLAALCAGLADAAGARQRLADAITRLDEAQISTIHGFCARVLGEHAFGAGVAFEAETLTDESALDAEIFTDFWRHRCAYSDPVAVRVLLGACPNGPADLGTAVLPRNLRRSGLEITPPAPSAAELAAAEQAFARCIAQFTGAWPDAREAAARAVADCTALSRTHKNAYKPGRFDEVLAVADAYAAAPGPDLPEDLVWLNAPTLAASRTDGAAKKNQPPPQHPVFDACQRLHDARDRLAALRAMALQHELLGYWRRERAQRKAARGQRGFEDLLTGLADALDGPAGAALAATLARTWPLALIDEFQDTDPVQWRIFERIYAGRPDTALVLIGDPKQAIYGFRGADVYTYLGVRRQVPPVRQHTLGTNHRSVAPLVRAVNALFARAPDPFVRRADIPFLPVAPAGRVDLMPLRVDGDAAAPFRVWWLPGGVDARGNATKRLSKEAAGEAACAGVAADVARLLRQAADGTARLGERALAGRDIGILVDDRHQARAMQAALRAHGVASVFRARESVYASDEAGALAVLLAAVADPANGAVLRAALAGPLIGLCAAELEALTADESAYGSWVEHFLAARERLERDGAGPMLLGLIQDVRITAQLAGRQDGGRGLTNLLHLGELLAATGHTSADGLLRALHAGMAQANGEADAQQLRLESDEQLVQVATVHASKGLEWPVVYLPFAWAERKPGVSPPHLFHDPQTLARRAHLGSDQAARWYRLAQREALAESVRKCYVALTRASHRCVLVWGAVNQAEYGPLAWLLHPVDADAADGADPPWSRLAGLDAAAWRAVWEELAAAAAVGGAPAIVLEDLPAGEAGVFAASPVPAGGQARAFAGRIARDWRITSFTGLSAGRAEVPDRPDHDALDAAAGSAQQPPAATAPWSPAGGTAPDSQPASGWGIARFPRGATAGTCLHALFEALDFPAAHGAMLARAAGHALRRAGYPPAWLGTLETLVGDVLDTPLDGTGFTLRTVARSRRRDELEFYFPLAPVTDGRLNAVLGTRTDFTDVPALRFEPVRGVLKGYVDLVFEHAGRFYLADYKSNWLGEEPAAYHPQALGQAMAEHRYDLQYLLYTVALHRHLRLRVPGYDYGTHFGGAYYLFLRGMRPDNGARTGVFFDRPAADLIDALERALCGEA